VLQPGKRCRNQALLPAAVPVRSPAGCAEKRVGGGKSTSQVLPDHKRLKPIFTKKPLLITGSGFFGWYPALAGGVPAGTSALLPALSFYRFGGYHQSRQAKQKNLCLLIKQRRQIPRQPRDDKQNLSFSRKPFGGL
jgi:hypothetical protein